MPAYQWKGHPLYETQLGHDDWGLIGCDIATDDIGCFALSFGTDEHVDEGQTTYILTWVLRAEDSLTGEQTIPFYPSLSGAGDTNLNPIVVEFVEATVTVPTGRCCFNIGVSEPPDCVESVSELQCAESQGVWSWDEGQLCPTNGGPPCANGACCQADGSCAEATSEDCAIGGGTFLYGAGCAAGVACCLPSGACIETTSECCEAAEGVVVNQCLGDGNGNGDDEACEAVLAAPAGEDCFRTTCGQTQVSFCEHPVPAAFFGPGSEPFEGVVRLGGAGGSFDTKIRRVQDLELGPPPTSDSTPIELAALQLVSCEPVAVHYADSSTRDWHVSVRPSATAPPQGSMLAQRTHDNGGVFSATLPVQLRFTFTAVDEPDEARIFDTAAAGIPPVELGTLGSGDWVYGLAPGVALDCSAPGFIPGVAEEPGTGTQCCTGVGYASSSASAGAHVHHMAPPGCTACLGGACCLQDGSCTIAEPDDTRTARIVCQIDLGGSYKGDFTDCRDSDGDGLADVRETGSGCGSCPVGDVCALPTAPAATDGDGDGCSDSVEIENETDPCDPCDSVPSCALPLEDCNDDGLPDACTPPIVDCNENGIEDDCEPGACCYKPSGSPVCFVAPKSGPFPSCDYANEFLGGATWYGPCADCDTFQDAVDVVEDGGVIFRHQVGSPEDCPPELPGQGGVAGGCTGPMVDPWKSKPSAGTMCHDFGATGGGPVPAGFFCPDADPTCGSDALDDVVCLEGAPLGLTAYGEFGDADTLIQRTQDPFDRCALPSVDPVNVDIEILALSLVSVDPVVVTYNGGQNPEDWEVVVDRSATVVPPPGTLAATKTYCNGGAYTSSLNVQPRFTFTRRSDGLTRVFDTGGAGLAYISLAQSDPAPWVHDVDPNLGVASDPCSQFHAGIEESGAPSGCDCNLNGDRDACDLEAGTSTDCNSDGIPDECQLTNNDCNSNGEPDECEPDCNDNDTPDGCDILGATSADCNGNGTPDECETDCNGNSIPDGCDLSVFMTSTDCDGNNRPDECDMVSGASDDCNTNEIPDGCDIAGGVPDLNLNGIPDPCEVVVAPPLLGCPNDFALATSGVRGERLSRFGCVAAPLPPATAGASETAVRVVLRTMYNTASSDPDDASACPAGRTKPSLAQFEGRTQWVGLPATAIDNAASEPPDYIVAPLVCAAAEAALRDWTPFGLAAEFPSADATRVFFFGAEVVPCSVYEVSQCTDPLDETSCSEPLLVRTSRTGDSWPPFAPAPGQPSFTDIGATVNKFKSLDFVPGATPTGAPPEWHALLYGNVVADYHVSKVKKVGFLDIGATVESYKHIPYKENGPCNPSTGIDTCGTVCNTNP
jgi:hypothetical protein